ncbi:hypothetical protein HMPREF1049_1540 [Fusobacterium necrophorum subsp. funduliforme ATCC 51357]|nr:hypothetical protein HMPREF1049_1540 [Fusobacterium necrophorum subsp. funduliforme ATCC 51357]
MDFYIVYVFVEKKENYLFSYIEKYREDLDRFHNIHLIQEY